MPLAGQVHACWRCTKRLPVDNVEGKVAVICPKCHTVNALQVMVTRLTTREQC